MADSGCMARIKAAAGTAGCVPAAAAGERERAATARMVVAALGGRYSTELGIDIDAGEDQVERWFLAATLFGARIFASVAERTYHVLARSGLTRIAQVRHLASDELIALLDEGGYARYDFRMASRLLALADLIGERYGGEVARIGQRFTTYAGLRTALDALPGWGEVTIRLFLRELRGVWPGARPPPDERAVAAARHLGLLPPAPAGAALPALGELARLAGLDLRDLESGLVRLALEHGRRMTSCPGGPACTALGAPGGAEPGRG